MSSALRDGVDEPAGGGALAGTVNAGQDDAQGGPFSVGMMSL